MGSMAVPDSVRVLEQDLRDIFGSRLLSLVVYRPAARQTGAPVPTLATIAHFADADLRACADRVARWHGAGLATPLIVPAPEFARALDAFPLEFGAILADHEVVVGTDPFSGLSVHERDLRRACEVQARSHLLHLREGFIETRGDAGALAELVTDSVSPLSGLVTSVARLLGETALGPELAVERVERAAQLVPGSLADVLRHAPASGPQASRMFPSYLAAVEQLTHFIDRWSRP